MWVCVSNVTKSIDLDNLEMQDIFLSLPEKLLYASSVCAALRMAQSASAEYALGPGEVDEMTVF